MAHGDLHRGEKGIGEARKFLWVPYIYCRLQRKLLTPLNVLTAVIQFLVLLHRVKGYVISSSFCDPNDWAETNKLFSADKRLLEALLLDQVCSTEGFILRVCVNTGNY